MGTQWRYTAPQDLRDLMKSSKIQGQDYVVVDVRDDDFAGGNVKGCLRAPFRRYEATLPKLVEMIKDVPTVVFHCAFSQIRGPKSARIYAEMRESRAGSSQSKQDILVLQGGFAAFQAAYKDDAELVEKWDKNVWEDPF